MFIRNAFFFITLVLSLSSVAAQAEGDTVKRFSCINKIFRDAKIEAHENDFLTVQDSTARDGLDAVTADFEQAMQLPKGSLVPNHVSVSVPVTELNCVVVSGLPLSCEGKNVKGFVRLSAFVSGSGNATSGTIQLSRAV